MCGGAASRAAIVVLLYDVYVCVWCVVAVCVFGVRMIGRSGVVCVSFPFSSLRCLPIAS
jgi:hypothetical protein